MRFLQKNHLKIARMATMGAHALGERSNTLVAAAALLQAEAPSEVRAGPMPGTRCARANTYAIFLQLAFLRRMAFGKTTFQNT